MMNIELYLLIKIEIIIIINLYLVQKPIISRGPKPRHTMPPAVIAPARCPRHCVKTWRWPPGGGHRGCRARYWGAVV